MNEELNQVVAEADVAADVAPPSEQPTEKQSIRQSLEKNFKQAESKDKPDAKADIKPNSEDKTTIQLDQRKPKDKVESAIAKEPEKPKELPKQLQGWRKEAKDKYFDLPAEVQAEIIRREDEAHKKITSNDDERTFGKTLKDTIQPYMPMIAAEGSDPRRAITDLLNTAYRLRNSTPEEKGVLLWELANQYGANMRIDPKVLQQRLSQRSQQPQRPAPNVEEVVKQQLQRAEAERNIEAFAADSKNQHFEKVKPAMATLLKNGLAKDLPDAYKKACLADDDLREEIINQQIAERTAANSTEESKRLAQVAAKTKAAKNASASVTGSPGLNGSADRKKGLTTRQALERAWNEHVN